MNSLEAVEILINREYEAQDIFINLSLLLLLFNQFLRGSPESTRYSYRRADLKTSHDRTTLRLRLSDVYAEIRCAHVS